MARTALEYLLNVHITAAQPNDHGKNMSEKGILMFMALRESSGKAGISQARLHELTGLSPRTIGTAIRSLHARQIIRAVQPVEKP